MIKTNDRLVELLKNKQARKEYSDAIQVLKGLRIFDILREVQSGMTLGVGVNADGKDIDLMNYHRMYGYMQALNDVEYLVESREISEAQSPDFSAYDS